MALREVNMTYEPFAKEPEYIEANQYFIDQVKLNASGRILDLACGIGTMANLLRQKESNICVVGMDISLESLFLAQKDFNGSEKHDRENGFSISFAQATADCLPSRSDVFDAVVMGNSIHMLPDAKKLLGEIHRVLRKGGLFAFNSSFYAGTMPAGTEKFHHEWMKQALGYIVNKDRQFRKEGKQGISRKRGTVGGAFRVEWPTPQEWTEKLEKAGFDKEYVNERDVLMTRSNFELIGAYGGFAKIILSGYPVAEASEALQMTAGPALLAVDMKTVPRLWLEIIARKK